MIRKYNLNMFGSEDNNLIATFLVEKTVVGNQVIEKYIPVMKPILVTDEYNNNKTMKELKRFFNYAK